MTDNQQWQEASIREYGDNQHVVLYVEKDHPAFARLKQGNGYEYSQHYYHGSYSLAKPVAVDLFYQYGDSNPKHRVKEKLRRILTGG